MRAWAAQELLYQAAHTNISNNCKIKVRARNAMTRSIDSDEQISLVLLFPTPLTHRSW